jgi:hypothetical protein
MVNLVKIEKDIYSFYEGKNLTMKIQSPNMDKSQLEAYRKDQLQLQIDAGALSPSIKEEVLAIKESQLEELMENTVFLYEYVLRGLTKEQWLERQ